MDGWMNNRKILLTWRPGSLRARYKQILSGDNLFLTDDTLLLCQGSSLESLSQGLNPICEGPPHDLITSGKLDLLTPGGDISTYELEQACASASLDLSDTYFTIYKTDCTNHRFQVAIHLTSFLSPNEETKLIPRPIREGEKHGKRKLITIRTE